METILMRFALVRIMFGPKRPIDASSVKLRANSVQLSVEFAG
jgi:hypothetical protein